LRFALASGLPRLGSVPHGQAPISSECASTFTLAVLSAPLGFVSWSPNSAARRPSGTKSVRLSCSPLAESGRS
jgi:hypothetical protein